MIESYLTAVKYHRRDSRGDKRNHVGNHRFDSAMIPMSGAAA